MLKDRGMKKGKHPSHLESALLSFRNEIAAEILDNIKTQYPGNLDTNLNQGIFTVARNNNVGGMVLLIKYGCNVDIRDQKGTRPLHFAAQNNSKAIGKLLISKGANVDAPDNQGRTPKSYQRGWIKSSILLRANFTEAK